MQIFELAKKHEKKSGEIVELLRKLGFTVKNHMAVVSDEMEKGVIANLYPEPIVDTSVKSEPLAETPTKSEEITEPNNGVVIFFSPSRCHDIAFKKETYFGASAKIKTPARSITFDDYEYRTSDPDEITHIKASRSFNVRSKDYPNGKIRIVTEDELRMLRQAKAPRMTGAKVTNDKATNNEVDMSALNAVPEIL